MDLDLKAAHGRGKVLHKEQSWWASPSRGALNKSHAECLHHFTTSLYSSHFQLDPLASLGLKLMIIWVMHHTISWHGYYPQSFFPQWNTSGKTQGSYCKTIILRLFPAPPITTSILFHLLLLLNNLQYSTNLHCSEAEKEVKHHAQDANLSHIQSPSGRFFTSICAVWLA